MKDEQFRTRIEDAQPIGWVQVGAVWITTVPLVDGPSGLYARLVYTDAEIAARMLGGRLPTPHELDASMLSGVLTKPVTLYVDETSTHLMMSRDWCETHDAKVGQQLAVLNVDESKVHCASVGKHWVRGVGYPPAYWAALYGWYRSRNPLDLYQSLNDGHGGPTGKDLRHGAATYCDYSSTTHVVRETEPPR